MHIAILGTGMVGRTLASKLHANGHHVALGSRTADNAAATAWVEQAGERASHGTFADVVQGADLTLLATLGAAALDVVQSAASGLRGGILIDATNPLDFSNGFPPQLFVSGDDSLGEQIQRALPETRVVKSLNTVACTLMVDPARLGHTEHTMFVAGNDVEAKRVVSGFLGEEFGWTDIVDLGDISQSRGLEAWLLLWVRLYGAFGSENFNIQIHRNSAEGAQA